MSHDFDSVAFWKFVWCQTQMTQLAWCLAWLWSLIRVIIPKKLAKESTSYPFGNDVLFRFWFFLASISLATLPGAVSSDPRFLEGAPMTGGEDWHGTGGVGDSNSSVDGQTRRLDPDFWSAGFWVGRGFSVVSCCFGIQYKTRTLFG